MANLASVNLNRLLVFVTVVEAGSLTAAANRLGLAKTMVSTHMQRLESEIGASLLVRTTRRLNLTDAGEAFYEASRRILNDAETAISAAGHDTAEPRGTLRITAPIDYGATVVAPLAVALQQRYPLLKIELLAGDRYFDLIADGIDVAIRIGRLPDSGYQAVRIGSFAEWLVATPQFLERVGEPQTPEDLRDLPFIALSVLPQPVTWTFKTQGKTEGKTEGNAERTIRFNSAFSANTAYAGRIATLAGAGLAILTDFAAAEDVAAGRLLRVLPDWHLPGGGIHAVFPAARHRPKKTRVFIDELKNHIDKT
ncbi:LysR family transcriptional regulator [Collimonas sp.]|jgi:DNA-binding transcriptional LysR family regulator|uniref:LysR family transcriptional regulator n=1 Tax=Collimonas sp. TaxID=1963772 RepID=UPI002BC27BD5|nr:LysR family transcriptional regulator [Collimonas sp.]HWW07237.1 LysR family transcriptional regulator [Collimonas sp.]